MIIGLGVVFYDGVSCFHDVVINYHVVFLLGGMGATVNIVWEIDLFERVVI
jgi:hypothetical protein